MAVAQLAASLALYGDAQRSEATFTAALQLAEIRPRARLVPLRLWLEAARRRRHAGACRRKPADAVGRAGADPHRRGRTRRDALDQHAGRRLDAACGARAAGRQCRAAADRQRRSRYTGAFSKHGRPARSCSPSPIVIANAGSDADPGGGDDGRGAGAAAAGRRRRLHHRAHLLPARRQRGQRHRGHPERALRRRAASVTESNSWASRVLVNDLLAGRLRDRQSAPRLQRGPREFRLAGSGPRPRISSSATTASSRPSTATDGSRRDITLAYVVRAVTPGVYVHPAASVEDMYRPQYSARTATGMMEVKAP